MVKNGTHGLDSPKNTSRFLNRTAAQGSIESPRALNQNNAGDRGRQTAQPETRDPAATSFWLRPEGAV